MPIQAKPQQDSTTGVSPGAPWRVTAVSPLPGYRLAVTFRDGKSGIADLSSVKTSSQPGIYAVLDDENFFAQVYLDLGVVTWPNGADLDPCWMHEAMQEGKVWSVPF